MFDFFFIIIDNKYVQLLKDKMKKETKEEIYNVYV